jgi:hypothetical protein
MGNEYANEEKRLHLHHRQGKTKEDKIVERNDKIMKR